MAVNVNLEGTKQLTQALVSILSPASETLGTLGDKIRVYRHVSLLRSLSKARAVAASEGLRLEEPPLKFLVPYLEDCSLEDPDNDTLLEMWARLFVDAATNNKSEHNLFIRILRELTSDEAKLFHYIATKHSHQQNLAINYLVDTEGFWSNPAFVSIAIRDILKSMGGLHHVHQADAWGDVHDRFLRKEDLTGSVIYYFDIAEGVRSHYPIDSIYTAERSAIDDDFSSSSIAILKALGLIGDFKSPEMWFENYCFEVSAYFVTELGASFASSCTDILKSTSNDT